MEKAVAGDLAGVLDTPGLDRKFRAVLPTAIDAIAGSQIVRAALPAHPLSRLYPRRASMAACLRCFPDVKSASPG